MPSPAKPQTKPQTKSQATPPLKPQIKPQIAAPDNIDDNPEVRDIFSQIKRTYGVPQTPPLYQSLANSPNVLKGTWGLSTEVMEKGVLPTAVKQIIFLAVSSARGCSYCELVYSALCKIDGISGDQIQAAVDSLEELQPLRTRDIVKFAIKVATDINNLVDQDYECLHRYGLDDSEILEIIAVAGLATYFNILADGMKVSVDEMILQVLEN